MKTLLGEMRSVNVETAANGQEALEICAEREFDVIFMDIHMPIMDGFEVTFHFLLLLGD